jgi:hypothetical protein
VRTQNPSPLPQTSQACHLSRYTLVQVFSKFGKIINVDFLFHKSGPHKGKPRGYAFIKYADENVSFVLSPPLLVEIVVCAHPGFAFSGSPSQKKKKMDNVALVTRFVLHGGGLASRGLGSGMSS